MLRTSSNKKTQLTYDGKFCSAAQQIHNAQTNTTNVYYPYLLMRVSSQKILEKNETAN